MTLCPRDTRVVLRTDDREGLAALQDRLVETVSAVKATATASRNRNKFSVPDEIRQLALDAAKCRNPKQKKELHKIACTARREFEASRALLSRAKVKIRPAVTKLWINGRASEDRDEWTEEVRVHCERCHDDKTETSEVQAERIQQQRVSGDHRAALQRHRIQITVDKSSPCTR